MCNAVAEEVGSLGGSDKAPPVEGEPYTGKRKRMGEESYDTHQELWERYMQVELRELEQRRNGQLSRALPGESQEELDRLAEDDQRWARAGLVQACRPAHQGRPARIESEQDRSAWIQECLSRQARTQ
jgi:hypothetical protein